MDGVRRHRGIDMVLLVLLLVVAGLACFTSGVVWIADFDDSQSSTGPAGVAAVVLAVAFVGALVTGAVRRSARTASLVVVIGLALAGIIWLGAL